MPPPAPPPPSDFFLLFFFFPFFFSDLISERFLGLPRSPRTHPLSYLVFVPFLSKGEFRYFEAIQDWPELSFFESGSSKDAPPPPPPPPPPPVPKNPPSGFYGIFYGRLFRILRFFPLVGPSKLILPPTFFLFFPTMDPPRPPLEFFLRNHLPFGSL